MCDNFPKFDLNKKKEPPKTSAAPGKVKAIVAFRKLF